MTLTECDPQAAADLLRALAHPMRLQILCRLLDGEVAVARFESELGLKQPNLSQQLGQLREAGLVTTRREAKSIFYKLADRRVGIILDALRQAFGVVDQPQRRAPARTLPRATAARPKSAAETTDKTPQSARSGGECGVFSVAGWPSGTKAR